MLSEQHAADEVDNASDFGLFFRGMPGAASQSRGFLQRWLAQQEANHRFGGIGDLVSSSSRSGVPECRFFLDERDVEWDSFLNSRMEEEWHCFLGVLKAWKATPFWQP